MNKKSRIGIIGVGMVGGALLHYFKKKRINPFLYDKGKKLGSLQEVNKADVIFVCVPTPFTKKKGFDLSYVKDAISHIKGKKIIVIKSTVWPGTTEIFQEKHPQHKFLFNPEFLSEATADKDMQNPDIQIIGYTKNSYEIAENILKILPLAPYKQIVPAKEAEMLKYFCNTLFSTEVIFANQMYDLCQRIGVNYNSIVEAASASRMINGSHLRVWHKGYRGYGGKCLPKDIRALIQFADKKGVDLKLHKVAEKINNKLMKEQGIENPENFSKKK